MEPVKLPSGAELKIHVADFPDSWALYQAVLQEFKGVKIASITELDLEFWKNLICVGLTSSLIEKCLWKCFSKVLYNGQHITIDTFENEETRQDFMMVCLEVGKANIIPFLKSHYAQFAPVLEKLKNDLV